MSRAQGGHYESVGQRTTACSRGISPPWSPRSVHTADGVGGPPRDACRPHVERTRAVDRRKRVTPPVFDPRLRDGDPAVRRRTGVVPISEEYRAEPRGFIRRRVRTKPRPTMAMRSGVHVRSSDRAGIDRADGSPEARRKSRTQRTGPSRPHPIVSGKPKRAIRKPLDSLMATVLATWFMRPESAGCRNERHHRPL